MASEKSPLTNENLFRQIQQFLTSEPHAEISRIVEDNSKLRQQAEVLKITNEQNLKNIAQLQRNIETVTEQNFEYSTQIGRLTQESRQLERNINDAASSIIKKDEELGRNAEAITELESAIKLKDTEIDDFKQCLQRERETSKEAEDARKALEHNSTLLDQKVSSYREKLEWLNQFTVELRKPDRSIMYFIQTSLLGIANKSVDKNNCVTFFSVSMA